MATEVDATHAAHVMAIDRMRLENLAAHQHSILTIQQQFLGTMNAVMAKLADSAATNDILEALAGQQLASGDVIAGRQIASKTAGSTPPVTPTEVFTRVGAQEASAPSQ